MKKLFISLIVLAIAIILTAIVAPIGLAYSFVQSIKRRNVRYFARVVHKMSVSIDQLDNVICGDLFNKILTKKGRNFGLEDDTVSEVLAKNRKGNLTKLGSISERTLNFIEADHLEKALIENVFLALIVITSFVPTTVY